jgi:glycogen synthase
MLFWENYSTTMQAARLIFTIHNLDSQGECRQEEFAATGLHHIFSIHEVPKRSCEYSRITSPRKALT